MARQANLRYLIEGVLRCTTPLHVGGLGSDPDVDLPLAVDGMHRYYVPGTSLAGALRSWAYSRAPELTEDLFGYQRPGSDSGAASRLVVEDARIQGATPEIREGVGINRATGAAAENILYLRAVLPAGTELPLRLAFETQRSDDPAAALLADVLEALEEGWVAIGQGTTRGYGRVQLHELTIRREDLASREGMLRAIVGDADTVSLDDLRAGIPWSPSPAPRLRFEIDMRSDGPLMVRSGIEGLGVDALPLVTTIGGSTRLVLSGSSIKGAMRSTAERIVRTLMDGNPRAKTGPKSKLQEQIDLPLVHKLFGAPARTNPRGGDVSGKGALSVLDTLSKRHIVAETWRDIEQASDAVSCRRAARAAGLEELQVAHHVSVDRWTGGAVSGRLFSRLEPLDMEWEPLVLEVDLARLGWPEDDATPCAALALLALVLHELSCGRLPLGFAVNRGMGGVIIERISIQGEDLGDTPFRLLDGVVVEGGFRSVPPEVRQAVIDQWQQWCDSAQAKEAARD